MNWLLVVLMLSFPNLRVDQQWFNELREAEVQGHYMDDRGRPGWYNVETREIHVVYALGCDGPDQEMLRRLSHEAHHYLAARAELGHWKKFGLLATKIIRKGDYNKYEVESVKGMLAYGGGYELHAELPRILEGEIPPELQRWYPWFDLGGKEKRR